MPRGNSPQNDAAAPGPVPLGIGLPGNPDDFMVVAIGASAGGLEACSKLLSTLSPDSGMAYIVVQHLDPVHESLLADLLAGHTALSVRQATDGMAIEPNHVYVIAPGTFLSIAQGALHVTRTPSQRAVRLPFDFLLLSLAEYFQDRAACIVLSGTGSDGSAGLIAIADRRGLVIVQEPAEAGHDGMPRAAIQTGRADLILPVARMNDALNARMHGPAAVPSAASTPVPNVLPEIVELLRTKTAHDFRLYKPGTLNRRIERRMAMAGTGGTTMRNYLDVLKGNVKELHLLAADLLINVTAFFRDKYIFDFLGATIVPGIVHDRQIGKPIRIWVAGCSTGQEAYSLAMLFRECLDETDIRAELQIFASDVDPDAIATARDGLYPATIATEISESRLARFFVKEQTGYRVSSALRATVIFTVQDILSDPPFSHLDMVSCRNVMIYMQPEAQAKMIGLFHFALRSGGILLLGGSETIGTAEGRFDVVSDVERVYRQTGRTLGGAVRIFAEQQPNLAAGSGCGPGADGGTAPIGSGPVSAVGVGNARAGGYFNQPQIRLPLFSRPDRPISARAAGRAHAGPVGHGSRQHPHRSSRGGPSGDRGKYPRRNHGGPRQFRWRRIFLQHRRPSGSRRWRRAVVGVLCR